MTAPCVNPACACKVRRVYFVAGFELRACSPTCAALALASLRIRVAVHP